MNLLPLLSVETTLLPTVSTLLVLALQWQVFSYSHLWNYNLAPGIYAPVSILLIVILLYLFRSVYAEVGDALPLNGGSYTLMLNVTLKVNFTFFFFNRVHTYRTF